MHPGLPNLPGVSLVLLNAATMQGIMDINPLQLKLGRMDGLFVLNSVKVEIFLLTQIATVPLPTLALLVGLICLYPKFSTPPTSSEIPSCGLKGIHAMRMVVSRSISSLHHPLIQLLDALTVK